MIDEVKKKTFFTKPNAWTPEIEEAVRVKWQSLSFTATEIAKELGPLFTKNAVIGKMTRLGFKGGKIRMPSTRPHNETRRLRRLAACGGDVGAYAGKRVAPVYHAPFAYALQDLPANGCHYPAGTGPYTFCGVDIEYESYCAYHFALTHYGHRSNTQQQRPATPTGAETPPAPSPPDAPGESLTLAVCSLGSPMISRFGIGHSPTRAQARQSAVLERSARCAYAAAFRFLLRLKTKIASRRYDLATSAQRQHPPS